MHYICKLLKNGHQIFTVGASSKNAPNNRVVAGLTYFQGQRGSKCKNHILYLLRLCGGTNRNRYTQKLVISLARAYWWTVMAHQKPGHSDLLYGPKKRVSIVILKPADRHSHEKFVYCSGKVCVPSVSQWGPAKYLQSNRETCAPSFLTRPVKILKTYENSFQRSRSDTVYITTQTCIKT